MHFRVLLFFLLGANSAVSKKTTDECSAEMDLCFVVDSSRSICYKDPNFRREVDKTCRNWNLLLSSMHNLVSRMDIGENTVRVGLVVFDCEATVRWDLTRHKNRDSLMAAIEHLDYTPGQANTSGGLDVSRRFVFDPARIDRPKATKVAMIMTDGKATDPTAVQPSIDQLHADNVKTYVVGISDAIDEQSLKQLASDPKEKGKTFWTVPDFDQLDIVLDDVHNQVCDDAASAAPSPGSSSVATSRGTRRDSRESTTATVEKSSKSTTTMYLATTNAQPTTTTQKTTSPTTTKLATTTTEPAKHKKTTASTTTTTQEPTTTTKTTVSTTTATPEPTTTRKTTTTEAEPTTVTTAAPKCDPSLSSSSRNLTNTVVYEGAPASFFRINNCQRVQWQLIASSSFYNQPRSITYYDDDVQEAFTDMVAVSGSQLTIFQSTVAPKGSMPYSSAGLYVLRYMNPNYTTAANLIVIKSGPLCTADASNPKNAKLNCTVVFAESPVQPNYPVFKWIAKNGTQVKQEQPIPSQISTFLKRSMSLLPMTSTDTATYECQLTFSAAPKSPNNYTELSPPNFMASCSVSLA